MSYLIHFMLEAVGGLVTLIAYKHVCSARWHRGAIWFVGTVLTTIVTVQAVG